VSGADRWAFVLVRAGNLYLIRAPEASRRCLVVRPAVQGNRLATGSCAESEETLFDLAATGRSDDRGRPTYYLTNSAYGTVQWSSDRAMVYVDRTEPDQIDTSFVLVDQGPA
jgi:hypothetical protein